MDNIHKCFEMIYKSTVLKAIIYFDTKQIASMLVSFNEYGRFIEKMIKPNAGFLIECDPKERKLINTIWEKRASTFKECEDIKAQLMNRNTYYISMEVNE